MGDNIIDCICALTIFVLSYWFFLTRKDVRRTISKLFLCVLIMGTLSCVSNLGCGIMDSRPEQYSLGMREAIHGLYLVTHSLVAPFMAWYFIYFTGVSHKWNTARKVLFTLPAIVLILMPVLIPPIRRKVYFFDADGVYQRGPYAFWTVMLGGLIYAGIIIATALRNRERLSREQKWAIGFLVVFFSVPTIFEVNVLKSQRISAFFEALGIFLVLLSVDNQNWVFHPTTQTYNRLTAQRHIGGYISSGIPFSLLILSISRSAYFRLGSFGSENFQRVMGMVGTFLNSLKTDVYYCEQGTFVVPVFSDSTMRMDTLTNKIAHRFNEPWQITLNESIHLPVRIITVQVPQDVRTIETLFNIADYPYDAETDETIFAEGRTLLAVADRFWKEGKKGAIESGSGQGDDSSLPDELLVMLDDFSENIADLTSTERKVVSYYLDGYDIANLPELMDISINTVRKHNRNIYQKLNIASREELMIYLDILERCGRLEPIEKLLKESA
jgi:DNA-binding CsgD family transcriptional regulator